MFIAITMKIARTAKSLKGRKFANFYSKRWKRIEIAEYGKNRRKEADDDELEVFASVCDIL